MQIIPRPIQLKARRAALKGLRSKLKRALVVLATGLGKTLTAAFIAKAFRAKRILFLVHNNFILDHAMSEFRLAFDDKTEMATFNGFSKDGVAGAKIVFATWQTMGKNLKMWRRNYFDLIIVDEAHHAEADTYRPVVDYFTGARLGITATPDRTDESDIRDVFGPEVINITLEEAIARGWLPRIEYHVITDESMDEHALQKIAAEIRQGKKRFTMAEVNRRIFIKKRDKEIARIIDGYSEKSIIFCASIKHAERMKKSLKLASVFHSMVGTTARDTWNKNQKVLNALRDGITRRVCTVNAFNEGVNVPTVGLVGFCRSTESLTIFRQQLGRGLRPGKDKLIVLDFVGNLERIQLVLEMMNKIADLHECYTSEEDREHEGYGRQPFEVSGQGFEFTFSDKVVDLMKILEHCEREFYPTWQEASEAAKGLGITTQESYTALYKKDSKLPAHPPSYYGNNLLWATFFGKTPKKNSRMFYATWKQASRACVKLGLTSYYAYRNGGFKKDPRLPSAPHQVYLDFPGWTQFFGKKVKYFYRTWEQASRVVRLMKISSREEYQKRYKEDPRLPSGGHINVMYKNFPGWDKFLSKPTKAKDWREASRIARRLHIKSATDYAQRYKKDSRLPSTPHQVYLDFPGWNRFLGK